MTEEEWLACEDPQAMAEFIDAPVTRKQTLFNVACCRRVLHLTPEAAHIQAVDAAEQVADGFVTEQAFELAMEPIVSLWRDLPPATQMPWQPAHFLTGATRHLASSHGWVASYSARAVTCANTDPQSIGTDIVSDPAELAAQVRLLRDIFGNPFRPVVFDPAWRTDTAVAIAAGMYESRDFGAMPILADALQDAGCASDYILSHCRDPQQIHVRGCWVVDLVLGKE